MLPNMDAASWLAFLSALGVVMVTPGTSVLLVVSQTLCGGRRGALWTVAGDLTANALQIAVVALAAAEVIALVTTHARLLELGAVSFLLVTGLRQIAGRTAAREPERVSPRLAFSTGFLVSITNPAAILFFALLLPLFVSDTAPALPQFATLGSIALCLDGVVLTIYALASSHVARHLTRPRCRLASSRVAGALRIAAAAVLAGTV